MVELIQSDGTAAPADYEVQEVTILAGGAMGSTMLTAVDDGMSKNAGSTAEMLTSRAASSASRPIR